MRVVYDPTHAPVDIESVNKWFSNILIELQSSFLNESEKGHILSIQRNASEKIIFNEKKRTYYKYAFSRNFAEAASYLIKNKEQMIILDLGCGIGSQSIYFALKGAAIYAIDLDKKSLEIFRKRIIFYEKEFSRKLDINLICSNAVEFDYSGLPRIDGIFSLFGFNNMQPSHILVDKLFKHLSDKIKIAIIDGNNKHWFYFLAPSRRKQVWSPIELEVNLKKIGYFIEKHRGGISLPYYFWKNSLYKLIIPFDNLLNGSGWYFPISQLICAEKKDNKPCERELLRSS